MSQKILLLALASGLTLVACGEVNNLHKMNDTTQKMSDTTTEMNTTTKELSDKTESMKNTTGELYDALRQGNTVQLRRDAWKAILEAPTMFRKISEAGKYFMSYEFQLWNDSAQDADAGRRSVLAQQAAKEFFLEIEELAPRDGSVNVSIAPDAQNLQNIESAQNRQASFNALAISMDQINRKQVPVLAKTKQPMMSMESIMEEALLAKKDLQDGQILPENKMTYIREVLAHEEKAIQILKTRYSLFPLVFIDAVTKVGDMGLLDKGKMVLLGWDLDLDQLNTVQLEYYQTEALDRAIAARTILKKLGIKTELDGNVAMLLNKMRIKVAAPKNAQVAALQTKLIDLLRDLQKN